jgi:RNA polymerase sigma-70 factor (ECF subfamily)
MGRIGTAAAAAGQAKIRVMETTISAAGENTAVLIERIKRGDREAFMHVTRRYQRKIYQLAYAFFRNHEDAMDIVQETFMRFHQKIDHFQTDRNFQNWLLQMARNLCIDAYRRHKKKSAAYGESLNIDELQVADGGSHRFGEKTDLREILARCLENLSEKQRAIFVMKHVNQLKYTEIAQVLGIAVGTVKSLNHKAIRNLRALMSPYLGVGYD